MATKAWLLHQELGLACECAQEETKWVPGWQGTSPLLLALGSQVLPGLSSKPARPSWE